ncbi:TPA: hypothetical protein ACOEP6_000913 [Enterobacter ludwigii]
MNHHEVVVTILEHPQVPMEAVLTIEMEIQNDVPVQETTLSIPSSQALDVFCSQLTYGYGVTFNEESYGTMDLYYIGKQGNYQQFYSHPSKL